MESNLAPKKAENEYAYTCADCAERAVQACTKYSSITDILPRTRMTRQHELLWVGFVDLYMDGIDGKWILSKASIC